MNVSIIISTWNNCEILSQTLERFAKCKAENILWEIVLINNNCTDETDDVVKKFRDKLPINYVKEPVQGLSRARNTGLKHALGDFIIFTDDDVYPSKDWIVTYWKKYLEYGDEYFIGGPIYSVFEDNIQIDQELVEISAHSVKGLNWGDKEKILSDKEFFISANWGCERKIILEAGGFNEHLGLGNINNLNATGEETDLMEKIKAKGYSPLYVPQLKIGHYVPKNKASLKAILKRKKETGKASAEIYYKNSNEVLLFGFPRWMLRVLIAKIALCFLKFLMFKKSYKELSKIYYYLGYLSGIRKKNNRKDEV